MNTEKGSTTVDTEQLSDDYRKSEIWNADTPGEPYTFIMKGTQYVSDVI